MLFWLVYEVILLLCEVLFILRMRAVLGVFAKIKKSFMHSHLKRSQTGTDSKKRGRKFDLHCNGAERNCSVGRRWSPSRAMQYLTA